MHIGSETALKQIEEEKKLGTKIFVETCPHYLTLSYEKQQGYLAKVMPPIRTQKDQEAVWNALSNNKIDTVGTDHVANQLNLKLGGENVWDALAGFPGIGTVIPILLSEGVNKNKISLEQFVQFTSLNAAKIFGMYPKKGTLEKGSDADITMIDLKKEKKVSNELFGGFSDYIVYEGGQHMQPYKQRNWNYNHAMYDAQIHPGMYDLYMKNFAVHTEEGVNCKLFMAFAYVSRRESKWGSWGHLERLEDINDKNLKMKAPKYKALLDINTTK